MNTSKSSDKLNIKSKKQESWKIFDQIARTYDAINKVISFGIDILWRKNFRRYLPDRNKLLCLDLATGTGDVALELANDPRVKHVLATDMSKEMIKFGVIKAGKKAIGKKVTFQVGDGVTIPHPNASVDIVTVAFGIRNFNDYKKSLTNMVRVLKPGGQSMILEFSLPTNKLFKKLYLFYFRSILPKIGNLFSRHKFAYTYLNKTVEDFPYGEAFADAMMHAGFDEVAVKPLSFGIATLYIGHKFK